MPRLDGFDVLHDAFDVLQPIPLGTTFSKAQSSSLNLTTNRISRLGIFQAWKWKKKLFHFCFWGRDALKKTIILEECF